MYKYVAFITAIKQKGLSHTHTHEHTYPPLITLIKGFTFSEHLDIEVFSRA